jgi:putative SOS response-associated peptidase YedK
VDTLLKLLQPFHPDELTAYPVIPLVNSVTQDSAKCVGPLEID